MASVGTDAVKHYMHIGVWALVGNDAVKTHQSLREVDNQGTVCVFFWGGGAVTMMVIELDPVVRGGEP